jgi:hypothetical protein
LRDVREGKLRPALEVPDEASALESLMTRYAGTPMSLAHLWLRAQLAAPTSGLFVD